MTKRPQDKEERMLPFFIEFVRFSTGFAALIAVGLLVLRMAHASL